MPLSLSLKLLFRFCDNDLDLDLDFFREPDLDLDLDLGFCGAVIVFVIRGFLSFDRERDLSDDLDRDLLTVLDGSDAEALLFNFLFRFFVGVPRGDGRAAAMLDMEEQREGGR